MTKKKENTTVVARVNFPLYSVQLLTCRHILVAGGGGAARTGVSNAFVSKKQLFVSLELYNCIKIKLITLNNRNVHNFLSV